MTTHVRSYIADVNWNIHVLYYLLQFVFDIIPVDFLPRTFAKVM